MKIKDLILEVFDTTDNTWKDEDDTTTFNHPIDAHMHEIFKQHGKPASYQGDITPKNTTDYMYHHFHTINKDSSDYEKQKDVAKYKFLRPEEKEYLYENGDDYAVHRLTERGDFNPENEFQHLIKNSYIFPKESTGSYTGRNEEIISNFYKEVSFDKPHILEHMDNTLVNHNSPMGKIYALKNERSHRPLSSENYDIISNSNDPHVMKALGSHTRTPPHIIDKIMKTYPLDAKTNVLSNIHENSGIRDTNHPILHHFLNNINEIIENFHKTTDNDEGRRLDSFYDKSMKSLSAYNPLEEEKNNLFKNGNANDMKHLLTSNHKFHLSKENIHDILDTPDVGHPHYNAVFNSFHINASDFEPEHFSKLMKKYKIGAVTDYTVKHLDKDYFSKENVNEFLKTAAPPHIKEKAVFHNPNVSEEEREKYYFDNKGQIFDINNVLTSKNHKIVNHYVHNLSPEDYNGTLAHEKQTIELLSHKELNPANIEKLHTGLLNNTRENDIDRKLKILKHTTSNPNTTSEMLTNIANSPDYLNNAHTFGGRDIRDNIYGHQNTPKEINDRILKDRV